MYNYLLGNPFFTGAVACQLMDYLFPGSIPLKRVNWEAKNSFEFVQNYKLLQAAFTKNRVQKYIDVDKLIRAKYQDNLEFCQWLKAFHDQQQMYGPAREDYDPSAARAKGKGAKSFTSTLNSARPARTTSSRTTARPTPPSGKASAARPLTANRTLKSTRGPSTQKGNQTKPVSGSSRSQSSRQKQQQKENHNPEGPDTIVADAGLIKKNAELASRNAELELTVAEIEKERDFYFEKLRDVEVLLQVHQERVENNEEVQYEALLKRVFKVLYATSEDRVVVDDDGELMLEKEIADTSYNEDKVVADVSFESEQVIADASYENDKFIADTSFANEESLLDTTATMENMNLGTTAKHSEDDLPTTVLPQKNDYEQEEMF